jgi:benzodiazapine receptor
MQVERRRGGVLSLVVFLAIVFLVGFFGSRFEPGAWYAGIDKAPWTPPNWLFGPVWTLLYIAIAVAGWKVWRRAGRVDAALGLWIAQLVLNAAWSWLFFGRHALGLALVDIVALLALIAAFVVVTWRLVPSAARLFLPYGGWVAYAATLNAWAWLKNPSGP